jgi:hypothetical protein
MNHVVEELGVVLAYRAEQLKLQAEQEARQRNGGDDMEDMQQPPQEEASENASGAANTSPRRKKPRKVVGPKKGLGPITDGKGAGGSGVLALCLSSRRNMCIHDRVMAESDREAVDSACRSLTASWVVEQVCLVLLSIFQSSVLVCNFTNVFSLSLLGRLAPTQVPLKPVTILTTSNQLERQPRYQVEYLIWTS